MNQNSEDTCWTVLRAASAGSTSARSSFSRAYASVIRGYLRARWSGRPLAGEIDDATQDVFIECLKPSGVLERADPQRGDFRGLLFGVVRNVARRFEERAHRPDRAQLPDRDQGQALVSDDLSLATAFDRSWARGLVRRAGELHRELALTGGQDGARRIELLERRFEGSQPIRDIAALWGVPAQEVHNAYRKARTEFYGCLREVVAFEHPNATNLDQQCRRLLSLLG